MFLCYGQRAEISSVNAAETDSRAPSPLAPASTGAFCAVAADQKKSDGLTMTVPSFSTKPLSYFVEAMREGQPWRPHRDVSSTGMTLDPRLRNVVLSYPCPKCGRVQEKSGRWFFSVRHYRCTGCGEEIEMTYKRKLRLFADNAHLVVPGNSEPTKLKSNKRQSKAAHKTFQRVR